jgi:hypothetical protein
VGCTQLLRQCQPLFVDICRDQRRGRCAHEPSQYKESHEASAHHQNVIPELGRRGAQDRGNALQRLAQGLFRGTWSEVSATERFCEPSQRTSMRKPVQSPAEALHCVHRLD